MPSIVPQQLAHFVPLTELSEQLLQKIIPQARELNLRNGETILRNKADSPWIHYLLAGEIEVRSSFFERLRITHQDERAAAPLEDLAANEAQITALDNCTVLRFSRSDIEQAIEANATIACQAQSLHTDEAISDGYMVEDSALAADWLSEFLHSPLVNHVSARDIQQLLACIDDIDFAAADEVVAAGEYGDYFYIVKSGLATVHTDPNGPYRGKEFSLMPGGYFGEEALVGGTIRNARVTMETDGTLGRLDPEPFNQFIRNALIVKTLADDVKSIIDDPGDHSVFIDVRLYPEYRQGHQRNSTNLPLPMLRERLAHLDVAKTYYITPEGGPRSELATFLMRQAGFNTLLLQH